MTKFILAGGCDRKHPEYLAQLARIISYDFKQPRILSCWFSNEKGEADSKFPEYKDYFLKFFPKGTIFERADEKRFIEQLREADVVYFHGGHTTLLLPTMEKYGDLRSEYEGKIIVGSSAGANYLSSVGFSPTKGTIGKGHGLVNVACIVHYGSEGYEDLQFSEEFWRKSVQIMRNEIGESQILLLPEGSLAVYEQ